ncbi:hypothetical protein [Crossiella sp. NPDC003009]
MGVRQYSTSTCQRWGIKELGIFFDGYVEAAFWSSLDWESVRGSEENPPPLELNYGMYDLSQDAYFSLYADCLDFFRSNMVDLDGLNPEKAGHDFWLTRNGHGAGFWDRGFGERGERLTAASKVYGECNLYAADGEVHVG